MEDHYIISWFKDYAVNLEMSLIEQVMAQNADYHKCESF